MSTSSVLVHMDCQHFVKVLQAVTPAFGRLAAIEARLEGDYRAGIARVGRESEEIAQAPISDAYIHV